MSKAKAIDLSQLSPEQMAQLKQQFEAEQNEKLQKQKAEREDYKNRVDATVRECFPDLQAISKLMSAAKKRIFETFKDLTALKASLYDKEEDQTSHSFSTKDGEITIIIGYNQNDGWDDTVNTGVAKVHDYLTSMITDTQSKTLVDAVNKLLAKDSKGNLKASRVLQLKKIAEQSGSAEFIDALNIIQDAYRPERSKEFVRCIVKDNSGAKVILPLSITDAALE